jgi:hypothetical protein
MALPQGVGAVSNRGCGSFVAAELISFSDVLKVRHQQGALSFLVYQHCAGSILALQ